MKYTTLAISLSLAGSLAAAQVNPQDHAAHHPEGAASAPSASAPPAKPSAATPEKFEQQMLMMQGMHKRMQSARTPAEKQALMAEHLKVMESGMEMMSQMGPGMGGMGTMGGMVGMGGMGGPATPGTATTPPATGQTAPQGMQGMGGMMGMHGTMERRMAMMEQMMQMMVDREAAMPRR
jgi:hypothetical protein